MRQSWVCSWSGTTTALRDTISAESILIVLRANTARLQQTAEAFAFDSCALGRLRDVPLELPEKRDDVLSCCPLSTDGKNLAISH